MMKKNFDPTDSCDLPLKDFEYVALVRKAYEALKSQEIEVTPKSLNDEICKLWRAAQ
jgi:hypothetical protein